MATKCVAVVIIPLLLHGVGITVNGEWKNDVTNKYYGRFSCSELKYRCFWVLYINQWSVIDGLLQA